jgi:hypothetical protein
MIIHPSKRLLALASSAAFLLSTTLPLVAQSSGVGTITGVVTDTSGAIVPGAAVVVTDSDTGITRKLVTNGAGEYTASFLQPGHYEVVLGGGSFGKVDRKNLLLTVGETLTISAALSAGSVSTSVDVTSETPILDTEKTEVSQTFDPTLLTNLPVATRNWSAFVLNTPNVVQDGGTGLRRRLEQQPDALLGSSWSRIRCPLRLLHRLHQGVPGRDLELLGGVRPGRRRPGQRHHQERYQRAPRRPLL